MKEITILGSNNGKIKASIITAFAQMSETPSVIANCDIEDKTINNFLEANPDKQEDFYSKPKAFINQDKCISCDKCFQACRFDAISRTNNVYEIIPENCTACGVCERVCPTDAISMIKYHEGKWILSNTRYPNTPLLHGELIEGKKKYSREFVSAIKNLAKQVAQLAKDDFVIVNASNSSELNLKYSLLGTAYNVVVAEPTDKDIFVLNDYFRLVNKLAIPTGLIIYNFDADFNKYLEIMNLATKEGITPIADIPKSDEIQNLLDNNKSLLETDNEEIKNIVKSAWDKIIEMINNRFND